MRNTEEIWRLVDAHQDDFIQLSDRVWETPELCYTEFRSCAEHTSMLEAKGSASRATSPGFRRR
jgi:aminobenzoyl-glutamate utilization protein B